MGVESDEDGVWTYGELEYPEVLLELPGLLAPSVLSVLLVPPAPLEYFEGVYSLVPDDPV